MSSPAQAPPSTLRQQIQSLRSAAGRWCTTLVQRVQHAVHRIRAVRRQPPRFERTNTIVIARDQPNLDTNSQLTRLASTGLDLDLQARVEERLSQPPKPQLVDLPGTNKRSAMLIDPMTFDIPPSSEVKALEPDLDARSVISGGRISEEVESALSGLESFLRMSSADDTAVPVD